MKYFFLSMLALLISLEGCGGSDSTSSKNANTKTTAQNNLSLKRVNTKAIEIPTLPTGETLPTQEIKNILD